MDVSRIKKQKRQNSKTIFLSTVFFLMTGMHIIKEVCAAESLKERPVIKNGTFYRNNRPVYMLGPFLTLGFADQRAVRPGVDPANPLYPVYSNVLNFELAKLVGFNSAQPFTPTFPVAKKFAPKLLQIFKFYDNKEEYFKFLKNYQNLPIVVDFSAIGLPEHYFSGASIKKLIKDKPDKWSSDLLQKNKNWHQFVPFCLENPQGWAFCETYYKKGAKLALEMGGNPYIYEIFNEPSYQCRCKWNQNMFMNRMKKQYSEISKANTVWGTHFAGFNALINTTEYEKYSGLWVDWLKFIGDRYGEILLKAKDIIKEVDSRDKVYFMEQCARSQTYLRTNGIDPFKVASIMDVTGVEGGVGFGFGSLKVKNELEAVAATESLSLEYQLYLDMARSFGKPVVNSEYYNGRHYNGIRFPTKKTDFTTGLWIEVMHGVSADYIYNWDKRLFDWKTMKEAKINAREEIYKGYSLLNPYAYPPESLLGLNDFKEEIKLLRNIVMPRPRIKGKIALLISNPTIRMAMNGKSPANKNNYEILIKLFYDALGFSYYPFDVIFEEQLEDGSGIKGIGARPVYEYDALVIPAAEFIYKQTQVILNRYLKKGGLVIASEGSLGKDEYGRQLQQINSDQMIWIKPDLKKELLRQKIVSVLEGYKILRPFIVAAEENGSHIPGLEFSFIDRGSVKFCCLINWQLDSKLVRLKVEPSLVQGERFYIIDPLTKELYLSPGENKEWTGDNLKKGILLSLPSQERVLLLICSDLKQLEGLFSSKKYISEKRVLAQNKKDFLEDRKYENTIKQEIKNIEMARQERNRYPAKIKNCFYLDISRQVNMAFRDDISNDRRGGWTDQGSNDLRNFPLGEGLFSGVPFRIIKPKENKGKSCIILKGTPRPYFPREIRDIPVDAKIKYIYFLHAVTWQDSGEIFRYRLTYDDHSIKEIPVNYGHEVSGWWGDADVSQAKIAWRGNNAATKKISVYCYRWPNPWSEKRIISLNIISNNTHAVPAILAITAERENMISSKNQAVSAISFEKENLICEKTILSRFEKHAKMDKDYLRKISTEFKVMIEKSQKKEVFFK